MAGSARPYENILNPSGGYYFLIRFLFSPMISTPFYIGDVYADPSSNRLRVADQEVTIEPLSMDVLCFLVAHAGAVCTRDDLFREVWKGRVVNGEALTRIVSGLRKALGDSARSPRFIETIPKRGYRLVAEVKLVSQPGEEAVSEVAANEGPSTSKKWTRLWLAVAAVLLIGTGAGIALVFSPSGSATLPSEPRIVRTFPVIVKDSTGIVDSLWQREVEAIVDVVVDESLEALRDSLKNN